jgi:hypothetical protein
LLKARAVEEPAVARAQVQEPAVAQAAEPVAAREPAAQVEQEAASQIRPP